MLWGVVQSTKENLPSRYSAVERYSWAGIEASSPSSGLATTQQIRGASPPFLLEQTALGERSRIGAGDDEMIEHSYVDQSQCLLEGLRQQFVRATRFGHT